MNNLITTEKNLTTSIPLIDVVEDFVLTKNSKHTQRAYRSDLVWFFNTLDIVMLEDLADYQLPEMVSRIQAAIDNKKKISDQEDRQRVLNARSVNRLMNSLRSFFEYLVFNYNYPKNPMKQFSDLPKDKYSNTQSLTRSEVIDLVKFAKGLHRLSETHFRNYLVITCLFNLALRVDECATLKWDDINLADQAANIYQKWGTYKLLPLPHSLCLLLQEFKALYGNDCPYAFRPTRNNSHKSINKPLSSQYIFNLVKQLAVKAAIDKKVSPHSLRKTFIELSLDNGEDLIAICNATGHSTIDMVKYYDTRDRLKNNAVHSLANLI